MPTGDVPADLGEKAACAAAGRERQRRRQRRLHLGLFECFTAPCYSGLERSRYRVRDWDRFTGRELANLLFYPEFETCFYTLHLFNHLNLAGWFIKPSGHIFIAVFLDL